VTVSPVSRARPAESIAGLMATLALFISLIGVVHRPVRVVPAAIVIALVAAAIGGRHARLAGLALAVGAIAFAAGMAVAVATGRPLW
jgi:hypothetical protein